MDITTKNIARAKEHADRLHWQYAEEESYHEALIAARARFRDRMAEHGYPQPEVDRPAVVEFAWEAWRRARTAWLGLMRVEG